MTRDQIMRHAIACQLVTTANRDGVYMDALERFFRLGYYAGIAQEHIRCLDALDVLRKHTGDSRYTTAANAIRVGNRNESR